MNISTFSRSFLAASLFSSLLSLSPAQADFASIFKGKQGSEAGDALQVEYQRLLETTLKALKDKGIEDVSNQITPPTMRAGTDVELKNVAWENVTNLRLLGHANEPLKLLMVLTGNSTQDTRDEVAQVLQVVKEINLANGMPPHRERLKLHLILSSPGEINRVGITEEDFQEFVEVNKYFASSDVWMQDWGEIGAVMVDGADQERTVVFDSQRGRGLAELPGKLAQTWSSHYIKGPQGKGAGNYGGNIEVTPDDYLVIGDTSTQSIRDMFEQMGYQDRLVTLATDWLVVGHVDEYVSFLPTPDTALGYTIVKADPIQAMNALQKTTPANFDSSLSGMIMTAFKRLAGYPEMLPQDGKGFKNTYQRVGAIHAGLNNIPMDLGGIDSATLIQENMNAAAIINAEVDKLVAFLQEKHGPDVEIPVVSLPTLFHTSRGKYMALTPGVANMVVLRKHLIIPDPLMPEFQAILKDTLPKLGFQPRLVSNLTYHLGVGQLHCGTNTFRHPNKYIHPRYRQSAESRLKQAVRRARFRRMGAE